MSEVKIVIYSLGLNIAIHPDIAKSVHFNFFGEFKIPIIFSNESRRLGAARVTIKDDIENVDSIARIYQLENHYTLFGSPSKIMESIFFSPIWTLNSLEPLLGGWNPDINLFQASIDLTKKDAQETLLSKISELCNAIIDSGRTFSVTDKIGFISSHVVLIVDDLETFMEQVSDFKILGRSSDTDVVSRLEVNFPDHPKLSIPYIHLGMLSLSCIVFEGKMLFSHIEKGTTSPDDEYLLPNQVREFINAKRNRRLASEVSSFFGEEIVVLDDSYHNLVQALLDIDAPDISPEEVLQSLFRINRSLDFYQLTLSLLKEHRWPSTRFGSKLEVERLDGKFTTLANSLRNRIDLEKMQIDQQRTIAENRKEDWFNRWSMYLAFFVLFEVISSFLTWHFPQGDVIGLAGFGGILILAVAMLAFVKWKSSG